MRTSRGGSTAGCNSIWSAYDCFYSRQGCRAEFTSRSYQPRTGRETVAHGVSHGKETRGNKPQRGERFCRVLGASALSPHRGSWIGASFSHGSRHGLRSVAPLGLRTPRHASSLAYVLQLQSYNAPKFSHARKSALSRHCVPNAAQALGRKIWSFATLCM